MPRDVIAPAGRPAGDRHDVQPALPAAAPCAAYASAGSRPSSVSVSSMSVSTTLDPAPLGPGQRASGSDAIDLALFHSRHQTQPTLNLCRPIRQMFKAGNARRESAGLGMT